MKTLLLGAKFTGDPSESAEVVESALAAPCASALCEHYTWPPRRPHEIDPSLIRPGLELHIAKKITGNDPRHSQVYVATIGSDISLALKIYQPSLAKRKDLGLHQSTDTWTGMLQQYRQEYWAYDRMHVARHSRSSRVWILQEPAVALVMELITDNWKAIPALNPATRQDTIAIRDAGLGLLAAAHAIVNCGIIHLDLAPRNILWLQESLYTTEIYGQRARTGPLPVIIDFAYTDMIYSVFDRSHMIAGNRMLGILTSFKFNEAAHDGLMFLLSDENVNDHLRNMLYSR
ncbi:hypothetical protein EXIGLDRAFT_799668 [Exidia glandulosa HHB12029]|uniref:Protein kinase domain-containing protein n=1 Tax=Exidia glandulosa HHB12029 TaxID=1314781 RepID=A0A166A246_EXIGL|nr:hypothetical protein EXIGLDRAFT_799668 [Exidia glandulosa HHB12029]